MTTCRLSGASRLAHDLMPAGWHIGLFGSTTSCPGIPACAAGLSDVDLVLVYPPDQEREALDLRKRLVDALAASSGLVADVVVLSTVEVVSSGFWHHESAVDLRSFVAGCQTGTHAPT